MGWDGRGWDGTTVEGAGRSRRFSDDGRGGGLTMARETTCLKRKLCSASTTKLGIAYWARAALGSFLLARRRLYGGASDAKAMLGLAESRGRRGALTGKARACHANGATPALGVGDAKG